MKHNPRHALAGHQCDGFTLVELMIAIAVALLLIVGVGYVFRKAADTVSMGQALSGLARDNRAVQATMNEDFQNMATDTPFLIIGNCPKIGYIDQADYLTDSSSANGGVFNPTLGGTYVTTSQALQIPTVHRQDFLAFCTRGKYQRRASATGFTDTTSSVEAMVWYGMASMLDNSYGTYWQPAQGGGNGNNTLSNPGDNPNNFYGTQWTLSRMCILLRSDAYSSTTGDPAGGYFPAPTAAGSQLQPLQGGSLASTTVLGTPTVPNIPIESNLFDLANTNIQDFETACVEAQTSTSGDVNWSDPLITMLQPPTAPTGAPAPYFSYIWNAHNTSPNPPLRFFQGRNWVAKPFVSSPTAANPTKGNVNTPFDQSAQMASSLMPGVTQFIVEYAGDYLNQDPVTGVVLNIWENGGGMGEGFVTGGFTMPLAGPTDGKLDFTVDPDGTHRIMWYGFPRDVAGNGVQWHANAPSTFINSPPVNATNGPNASIPTTFSYSANLGPCNGGQPLYPPQDVVPLRDLLQTCPQNATYPKANGYWVDVRAPFEQTGALHIAANTSSPFLGLFVAQGQNYDYVTCSDLQTTTNVTPYVCCWSPADKKPWLIRITITVNDPNRAVRDGQTFEYIFNVPH